MLLGVAACDGGVGPTATGDLSVSTVTNGSEPDADGYVLIVDADSLGTIDPSGSAVITDLPTGSYTVLITGVAANCAASGDNPRTVSVVAGQTVQTTFDVRCSATKGSITVTTATVGDDPDDAYTLSVDGEALLTVAGNGTSSLSDLPEGTHTLHLGDVGANCAVAGENPRGVIVVAGETESTTFEVSCVSALGELSIAMLTSGQDLDPDGYTLVVDGESPQLVGIGDTVVVSSLPVGPKSIELSGVAANCTVNGANPRSVTVAFGATVTDAFEVACTEVPLPAGKIVFHSDRDGDFEIYSIDPDGSNLVQLTDNSGEDLFPAVSADGEFIAFTSNRDGSIDLYTMRADGSNQVQVTNSGLADRTPAWSPDGSRLAFARTVGGTGEIYTIRVDGSELTRLTDNSFQDTEPAWSPDGQKIAFTTDRDGADEVYTMNAADGSDLTNLTNHPGRDDDADWSPDGRLILFHRNDSAVDGTWLGDGEIMCMAADGSGVIRMTTDASGITDWKPRWAPGGFWYVFSTDRAGGTGGNEIFAAHADGCQSPPTSATRVTESPGSDAFADWSP
jgi:dipeptidyl aminopeptidase/acylaminoacyl peptidase